MRKLLFFPFPVLQFKIVHPPGRVRRSFSFSFETGKMCAKIVSLRTGKKLSSETGAPYSKGYSSRRGVLHNGGFSNGCITKQS